jgi:hypothetical protein
MHIGVVLNAADRKSASYNEYYGYSDSGYYYSQKTERPHA